MYSASDTGCRSRSGEECKAMRDINILSGNPCDIPRYIARNPYAWPGGYDIIGVCGDGEMLCAKCIRDNYKLVMAATRYDAAQGWDIAWYMTADWVEESTLCCNCYRELCPYDLEDED